MKPEQITGALLFSGALQFILCMLIAESIYPNYSISNNFISELGVGMTSSLFNVSIILLGACLIVLAYFIGKIRNWTLAALVLLTGIGAIGVGIFPMVLPGPYHMLFSSMAFLFGGLAAMASYRKGETAIGIFSIAMGMVSLASLALFASGNYLPLGMGLTERLVAWPVLLWSTIFGFNMMRNSKGQ